MMRWKQMARIGSRRCMSTIRPMNSSDVLCSTIQPIYVKPKIKLMHALLLSGGAMGLGGGCCYLQEKKKVLLSLEDLLNIYEEIDANMSILSTRMLHELELRVADDSIHSVQHALDMSLRFENTLEKVQDSVFRTHGVLKETVKYSLSTLVSDGLEGGAGPNGTLSVEQADALNNYTQRMQRMRWEVTGSREALISAPRNHPTMPIEKLIPRDIMLCFLNDLYEAIFGILDAMVETMSVEDMKRLFGTRMEELIVNATEVCCVRHKINMDDVVLNLVHYDNDPIVRSAIQKHLLAHDKKMKAIFGE